MRLLATLLIGVFAMASLTGVSRAADGPGALVIEAAPTKVSADAGVTVLRIANPGGAVVTAVVTEVDAPLGTSTMLEGTQVDTIPPGGSALVKLVLRGPPGVVVVKVRGQSGSVSVTAATAVEVVSMAPHNIALVGNTRLTERSPAELRVLVTNASDTIVHVELMAGAGKHAVDLEKTSFSVAPRAVEVVGLTVRAVGALRRGSVGVDVRAKTTGGQTQHLLATRDLTVSLASDELPGPLGVGSMIVLPGLVALLVFFELRYWDRKRIGAAHGGAKTVWDNKTWLLVAGGISITAASAYGVVTGRDVLDAYELSDIAVLTVSVGGVSAAVALATIWKHRRNVRIITNQSSPIDVLLAAQRNSNYLERKRYRTADAKHGLLVHQDGKSLVLTPPVAFESGGPLFLAWNNIGDPERLDSVIVELTDLNHNFDGYFKPAVDDITAPMTVDQAVEVGRGELLIYVG